MNKTAIVLMSDPANGDEALGRTLNGLAAAKNFAEDGSDVTVVFAGTGTRWLGVVADPSHPLHGLFEAVRPNLAGASPACATFFDATEGVTAAAVDYVDGVDLPGVGVLPSFSRLAADGYNIVVF